MAVKLCCEHCGTITFAQGYMGAPRSVSRFVFFWTWLSYNHATGTAQLNVSPFSLEQELQFPLHLPSQSKQNWSRMTHFYPVLTEWRVSSTPRTTDDNWPLCLTVVKWFEVFNGCIRKRRFGLKLATDCWMLCKPQCVILTEEIKEERIAALNKRTEF